jgi:hypothetical protein
LFNGPINTGRQLTHDGIVPGDAAYARFSMFDAKVRPAGDLGPDVYRGSILVGSSRSRTLYEWVNLANPSAATYTASGIIEYYRPAIQYIFSK